MPKPNTAPKPHHPPLKRRILIIHQNFPGQFRHVALHLQQRNDVEVIGLGRESAPGLPNFPWYKYSLHRPGKPEVHRYLRQMESAVLHGQAVVRALGQLKARGFTPDVILAHPGWGETLYVKQVFPQAQLIHFAEWFYGTSGADFNFDPEFPAQPDDHLRMTTWNALHLLNLENCDAAISPTAWQKSRHPSAYQHKIQIIHEGVDTQNLGPDPTASLQLPLAHARQKNAAALATTLTLKAGDPIITYVARNLEPYRGFHSFMRALPAVLKAHPAVQVLIVGSDGCSYGQKPEAAANWRSKMLQELGPQFGAELNRVHFLGRVPYDDYKRILQISSAHVYLTYPFVLSWSVLEAMASGCFVIASDTAPVREVIQHGHNGWLVDFFQPEQIAQSLLQALKQPEAVLKMRQQAQRSVSAAYRMDAGLAAYLRLLGLPF